MSDQNNTTSFEFDTKEQRETFINSVNAIIEYYEKIQGYRDMVNETLHDLFTECGIPKAITRKVARLHMEKKATEFNEEAEMVNALYSEIRNK